MMMEKTENTTKKFTVMDFVDTLNAVCDDGLDFCDDVIEEILDSCRDKTRAVVEPYSDAVKVLYDGSLKVVLGKSEMIIGYCMLGTTFATQMVHLGKKVIAKLDDTDIKVYK